MDVQLIPVEQLTLDPDNAREHPDVNLSAIKESLRQFGFQKPIVANSKGVVLAGNGALMAAKELGMAAVPVVYSDIEDENLQKAYALADNRTQELSVFNQEILARHLRELDEIGFDVESIGFEMPDFQGGGSGAIDDDEVPETPENIHGVKLGQLWQLGEHRLLCGDSTDKAQVDRLMGGEKADMVFTDPPYGIDFNPINIGGKGQKSPKKIVGDTDTSLAKEAFSIWHASKMVWWGGNYFTNFLPVNGAWIVWNKMKFDKPDQPFSHCELAWTNFEGNAVKMFSQVWDGCFRQGTKKDEANSRLHPNQKPVGIIEQIVDGALVADPFSGSGSTLIACEKTGRKCYAMEIDPHYCSVIIERWQQFTQRKAELISEA